MILKIDQTNGSTTPLRLAGKARTGAALPAPEAAGPRQQDGIASHVRQLREPPDATFDAAKVQAIREEIRAGRYKMDPARIADGMLASLRNLLPGYRG